MSFFSYLEEPPPAGDYKECRFRKVEHSLFKPRISISGCEQELLHNLNMHLKLYRIHLIFERHFCTNAVNTCILLTALMLQSSKIVKLGF